MKSKAQLHDWFYWSGDFWTMFLQVFNWPGHQIELFVQWRAVKVIKLFGWAVMLLLSSQEIKRNLENVYVNFHDFLAPTLEKNLWIWEKDRLEACSLRICSRIIESECYFQESDTSGNDKSITTIVKTLSYCELRTASFG